MDEYKRAIWKRRQTNEYISKKDWFPLNICAIERKEYIWFESKRSLIHFAAHFPFAFLPPTRSFAPIHSANPNIILHASRILIKQ